jgi:uncharacterized damage-inducible protein DinB
MDQTLPEIWLRGPVSDVPTLLQPAAHALLQAAEEIHLLMKDFPDQLLWEKPAALASPGFHLLHITGVLHRLCTYAQGKQLSNEQLAYLKAETAQHDCTTRYLVEAVERQVEQTIEQFKTTTEASLGEPRAVGRKALPSTVQGLLFHAAEHTMRHLGQLLVTVKVLQSRSV